MNESIVIKIADESYTKSVFDLTKKCFNDYQKVIGENCKLEALKETIKDVEKDIKENSVYVCELDNVLVGSVRVYSNKYCAIVSRFGIDPSIISKGIGTKLMSTIIEDLKAKNIDQVSLFTAVENQKSIKFYEKFGFYIDSTVFENGYERAFMILKFKK